MATARVVLSFLLLGVSARSIPAQKTKRPTLAQILERLQKNLDLYDSGVPSIFCDERVVSQMAPSQRDQDKVTDSIFRLKRVPHPDHTTTLEESREIKTVDGKPATSQNLDGPTLITGAFEGGLAVVSLNQTSCMNYTLQRINPKRPAEPYIVRFANVLTPRNSAGCLLQEPSKGRVFIDPATMQITRMELTTPHHTIIPDSYSSSRVIGERVLAVDFAPVVLESATFWMPSVISSRNTSGAGTFHTTVWSYRASYRNYHKLEVTSRILP